MSRKNSAAAAPAPAMVEDDDGPRLHLNAPVDVRSLSLAILAVIAGVFALQWAREVIIPLLLGVMFSYALTPAVDRLARWRVPRAAGAALVLGAIVAALVWGTWSISDDANALIESLPQIAQKLRQTIQGQPKNSGGTIAKVQQAAAEIEKAAEDAAAPASAASVEASASGASASPSAMPAPAPARPRARAAPPAAPASAEAAASEPTHVVVEKPRIDVRTYLWTGTLGLVAFLGKTAIVLFITFFLLTSGDLFRRKMVKLAGPRLSQKRITVQALDEITGQIQRYLLVQLAASVVTGALTGFTFYLIGLDHAAAWGVLAGIANLVPYLGAVLVGGTSAIIGFIQFGSYDMAMLVGGTSFAIHGIVGNLLTPWLTGRAGRMSPFVVFVAVLVFGWLWGPLGLILGVPIVMVVKAVCDRVDELEPVGEFLGA